MKKTTWIVIVVVIVAALIAVRVKRMQEKENAPLIADVAIAVDTATVSTGEVVRSRHVLGTVTGADEASIAPRVMSQVMEVKVREGDRIAPGDLLVVLDARELEDAVAQAEARVQAAREGRSAAETAGIAQRDATARDHRLHEAKAISDEQWERSQTTAAAAAAHLEAARAQVEIADRRLDQARTRMTYCRITSPVAGVVARRLADPGDLAVPGKPLLEIVRQESVRVRAELAPEDLPSLAIGLPVRLTLGEIEVEAAISRVFPAMGKSRLAAFEADLEAPPAGFVSGATVGVDVRMSSAVGLRVPVAALLEGEDASWVFMVADGVVHPIQIEVLDRSLEEAVISGPVDEGASVVVARPSRLMTLAEGMKVRATGAAS
ncbi:MAG: efflux RND transporter periplasmic adaptor subunit [Deltaproteobacteria bacterium]|nr:efflux RND transporter periplasmic adaptor subunit [Deltaproteobacteria bacterium]